MYGLSMTFQLNFPMGFPQNTWIFHRMSRVFTGSWDSRKSSERMNMQKGAGDDAESETDQKKQKNRKTER